MINWLDVEEVDHFYHSEDFEGETWVNEDDRNGLVKLMEKGIATAGKIEDSSTIREAKRWIAERSSEEPFFLGINLQNTHFSYVIPEGGEEPFKPDDMGFRTVYYRWPIEMRENVRNRYLNAVYNVDAILSDFVSHLQAEGQWEDTMFVVVGDSGEAFYEHGVANHSGPMYNEVVRTFALMKLPVTVNRPSARIAMPISHIDIPVAILEELKMAVPDDFQGTSPFDRQQPQPIFMHTNAAVRQEAVVEWPWKLTRTNYPAKMLELYNLENDPYERTNMISQRQDIAVALFSGLERWGRAQIEYYGEASYWPVSAPPRFSESLLPLRVANHGDSTIDLD
jgi:arylsulfatase A-like enzyme